MKAKIITFKPCKTGEVTLYLGKGVDLRSLIDLIGEGVVITKAEETEKPSIHEKLISINANLKLITEYIASIEEE